MHRILRYVIPVPVGVGMLLPFQSIVFAQEDSKTKSIEESLYEELNRNRGQRLWQEEPAYTSPTELEKNIAKCRKEVVPIKDAVVDFSGQVVSTTKDTSNAILDNIKYIQTTAPIEMKIGTIAGSAVFGMILGIRRGFFRKLFNATLLGGTAAAIIYPSDAKIVSQCGWALTKQYTAIAYNFIVGAQPTNKDSQKPNCKASESAAKKDDCGCENSAKK